MAAIQCPVRCLCWCRSLGSNNACTVCVWYSAAGHSLVAPSVEREMGLFAAGSSKATHSACHGITHPTDGGEGIRCSAGSYSRRMPRCRGPAAQSLLCIAPGHAARTGAALIQCRSNEHMHLPILSSVCFVATPSFCRTPNHRCI